MIPGRRSAASTAVLCVAVSMLLGGCAGVPTRKSGDSALVDASASGRQGNGADNSAAPAVAAYRAMWKDLAVASAYADPQWPHLADHADDQALRFLRRDLEKAQAEDVVTKGVPRVDPLVVASDANTVKLRDCVDESQWLHYTKAGAPLNHRTTSRSRADATVASEEGVWKVTTLSLRQSATC
jgi:hypothetical protein